MCACVGADEQRVPQPVRAPRDDTGKARSCENGKGRKERMRAGSQKHELLVAPRDGVQVARTHSSNQEDTRHGGPCSARQVCRVAARALVAHRAGISGAVAGGGCGANSSPSHPAWTSQRGTQHVVLGFRREGTRKRACASGVGSAGEPRIV